MRGKTKQIALCGILSALSITVLFLGTVIEVLDLTSIAIVCFGIYIMSNFYGYKWGVSQYLVISVLSAVFFSGKFIFLAFVSLGFYPVLKNFIDYKLKSKFIKWVIKLFAFNIGFTVLLILGKSFLFGVTVEYERFIIEIVLSYFMSNAFIVLYDILCDKLLLKYGKLLFKLLK